MTYALITPARNEAAFIGQTIASVMSQTCRPARWIIVSDGSTDDTDAIVSAHALAHPWIELMRVEQTEPLTTVGKARAFNTAYATLRGSSVDIIGNLDADVVFDAEFMACLVGKFAEDPTLGIAGGLMLEPTVNYYDFRFTNIEHVSGGCQLFRAACLSDVGGYATLHEGIDTLAVLTARMKGWRTRTFTEKAWLHRRTMDSQRQVGRSVWFHRGRKDFLLGNPWWWQAARGVYQMALSPVVVRGALISAGYVSAAASGSARIANAETRAFVRREQSRRMRRAGSEAPAGAVDLSLDESLFRLEHWVERHGYKAYEPFDGLSSPLRPLTLGVPMIERAWQQAVRRAPVNVRPLLGVRPLESTKGRGYMARGYLARWRATGHEDYRVKAIACLEWLMRHKSPHADDYSWGNHFDFTSRAGRHRAHESIIVWTSLIGQAFLDAFDDLGDERYLDVARSVCAWILKLPRERSSEGACLSYLAARQLSIHNANLLGAAMLARTAAHTNDHMCIDVARDAVRFTCASQRDDGSWYYAEPAQYHWIDSFHTGYNLDSLQIYGEATGDTAFDGHLSRGLTFFRQHFFESDGTPRYYHDRTYPIDIQCAAQAIETFVNMSGRSVTALDDAWKVARWTMRHMQDPGGSFYYRKSRRTTNRTPMLHWGQATMHRALSLLALKSAR